MRIIGDIPHPAFKITLMHWNDRFMVKFEHLGTELIFKFREGPLMEISDDLEQMVDNEFLKDVSKIYEQILQTRTSAISRQEARVYGDE